MHGDRSRALRLERAVRASILGDSSVVDELYTADVRGWSPRLEVSSAAELAFELELHDSAFSDMDVHVSPLDVNGPQACVEWQATAVHSGAIGAGRGVRVAPTGKRVLVRGATIAEFDGERICSFRQYWDELSLLVELGLLPR